MLLALLSTSLAAPPVSPTPESLVLVGPTALSPVLAWPDDLKLALFERRHADAAELLVRIDPTSMPGAGVGDAAFVTAWTLQRANRGADALKLLPSVEKAENAPPAYVDLVVGELLLADGKPVDAVDHLLRASTPPPLAGGSGGALDPTGWHSPIEVRALLALADAFQKAGRTADARAVWTRLAERPDPSPGSAAALWILAQRAGDGSPEAAAYLDRLYRYYPGTPEDKAAAGRYPAKPSIAALAARGDTLQESGRWDTAADLLDDRLAEAGTSDAAGCQYRYAYGRAQYKRNNITIAAEVLQPLGKSCRGVDDDRGAKALYLAGKALERKKEGGNASRAYLAIPELYPTHSMADDGYALGGIMLQQSGDLAAARSVWAKGLAGYPDGDLAGENAWRLAWGAFLAGDTAEAIRWAEKGATEVPLASSPTDVLACRYWAARWKAWPSATDYRQRTKDAAALAAAADGLEAVARDAGWHYYGLQAAARLRLLDPARAEALSRPPMDAPTAMWSARSAFLEHPAVRNAFALVRIGLYGDALVELSALDEEALTGSEMAIVTGIQADGGDFLFAHDRLRQWLKTHPPQVLGPNAWKVMVQAYPERWWPEVQAAASYPWDARIFHALVREESNFNPQIKSHAGACGLSQLMPGTASGCAKRMGLSFRSSDIWDPATNLKIGAWYLDTLHSRYKGNSAVALSAYNAGEGNADRWLAAAPDSPTDMYVESITFRETRMYVKRVLSTWQTYRLLYGEGPLYEDWSRIVEDAVP